MSEPLDMTLKGQSEEEEPTRDFQGVTCVVR